MRHILSPQGRQVLERFAWSEVLLAFDYDGTLSPIVARPADATIRPSTRRLLQEIAARYTCAVISGRARGDLRSRLEGIPVAEVIGNHGLEPSPNTRLFRAKAAGWVPILERSLGALPGLYIEDKGVSVTLHYRNCRRRSRAVAEIRRAIKALGPLRVMGGKLAINLLPEGAPHKGGAIEQVRKRLRCETALYVGDDITDEDVFALDQPARLLTIRVGRSARSQAAYYLRTQAEIDALLRFLRDRSSRLAAPRTAMG